MTWKSNFNDIPVVFDADMALYTTYKTGGKAEVLALPKTPAQLKAVMDTAKKHNIPFRLFGLGSNILVSNEGLKGISCCLKDMQGIEVAGTQITALAGTALDNVIATAAQNSLDGLQNLSGIPGSVGGAVFMNAGAFDAETFQHLKHLTVMDEDGQIKTLNRAQVNPHYRHVEGIENCIVLSATWQLTKSDSEAINTARNKILAKRTEKQPLDYPSAGSVFKRPQGDYASRLIDICGLRGFSVGGAQVSPKHAGFIINYNKATATDIRNLMTAVQTKVAAQTGIHLELEQVLWGFEDK